MINSKSIQDPPATHWLPDYLNLIKISNLEEPELNPTQNSNLETIFLLP